MEHNKHMLMQYYMKYLKDVRGLSDSSVNHYTQALNKISMILKNKNAIVESIYEIKDIDVLSFAREILYADQSFVEMDRRGNRMYSAGLNNYYRFASGKDLFGKKDVLRVLDLELPVGEKITVTHEEWKRSAIIKVQTIEASQYQCEVESCHTTFVAKRTGKPYMEGHHAIPMKYQDKFDKSIDIYANVVCLCPMCHRMLHYGMDDIKTEVLDRIYDGRKERLYSSGIVISREDFLQLAI